MSVIAALIANNVQTLTAIASPELCHGARSGAGTCFTSGTTAMPVGGSPGYTYSWAKVSGDTFTISPGATAAGVSFSIALVIGDSKEAVYRCTVTSSDGQTATCDVVVTALEVSYF